MALSLNDGQHLPSLAFGAGTKHMMTAAETGKVVIQALDAGFRAIDCSTVYETNRFVGAALKEWFKEHKREELFISMKGGDFLKQPEEYDVRGWIEQALRDIGVDYFDLYMVHTPEMVSNKADAWKVMEQIKKDGLARSIGVSDFGADDLQTILDSCTIPPAVNQLEFTPQALPVYKRLLPLMKKHNIAVSGFGAMNPMVYKTSEELAKLAESIAADKGWTSERVLLQWSAQEGGAVVTTSSRPDRMSRIVKELNSGQLSSDEIEQLNAAGAKKPFLQWGANWPFLMHGEGGYAFCDKDKSYMTTPAWLPGWSKAVREQVA